MKGFLFDRYREWLTSGDVGMSSESLLYRLIDGPGDDSHPHDADDLGRCLRMLKRFPNLYNRLPLAADMSETWAHLIENWPLLVALYDAEDFGLVYNVICECEVRGGQRDPMYATR